MLKKYHVSKNLWSFGTVSIAVGERLKTFDISLPSNTYTIKAKYSSTNTGSVTIGIYDENEQIHTYNATQIDGTVSCSYTGIITAIRLYTASGYSPSASYSADFTEVMLNTGSTALPFEPYGNTWAEIPYRKYATEADTITSLPTDIIADGQPVAAWTISGNMQQSSGTTNVPSKNVTVANLEASTNYAAFAKADFPDIVVGDSVSIVKGGVTYSQKVMKIDASYVYIENRTV